MKPIVLVACALLAGCSTTKIITQTEYIVVKPPETLYNCPQLTNLPDPETLTNKQSNDVLAKLWKYNGTCGINIKSIHDFIEKAEAIQKSKQKS
jgi:hypothetical protein